MYTTNKFKAILSILFLININIYASDVNNTKDKEKNMKELLKKISALPHELQEKKEKILSTKKSYIKISLHNANGLSYKTSKVGGIPYLPKSENYPLDKKGKYMEFLAQINFSEMPNFEDYPKTGLLQFFISFENWGFNDYDNPLNNDIKIIYRENLDKEAYSDYAFLNHIRIKENSPISKSEYRMSFSNPIEEVASSRDYRSYENVNGQYQHYLNFDSYDEKKAFELESTYWKMFSSAGHKVGGYADFSQQDPRFFKYQDYTELLFQLDSDSSTNILWGDNGIANFFIKKEDLKNRNFSNILFHWDSH